MIRKSTGKALLLTLIIAAIVSTGYAQAIIKIGVVDSQKVLQESKEGKTVMNQLQEKDKRNSAELSRRDEEIRNLQTKLNTQRLREGLISFLIWEIVGPCITVLRSMLLRK
jgi:Skp family chaperone for outer membrane proteins